MKIFIGAVEQRGAALIVPVLIMGGKWRPVSDVVLGVPGVLDVELGFSPDPCLWFVLCRRDVLDNAVAELRKSFGEDTEIAYGH